MTETETKTDELCRQSIQAYLDLKGIHYTQEDHYLRLKDHDSLVVDTRVTPSKPYETFYWNSRGVGGNLFHFLHQYEGLDGSTAMKTLEKIRPALSQHKKNMSQVVESKPRVYEQWRWRGRQPTHASFDYLTKTRKLSPKLIQEMYKAGLLRELRNGDAFFVWYDHQHKQERKLPGELKSILAFTFQLILVISRNAYTSLKVQLMPYLSLRCTLKNITVNNASYH